MPNLLIYMEAPHHRFNQKRAHRASYGGALFLIYRSTKISPLELTRDINQRKFDPTEISRYTVHGNEYSDEQLRSWAHLVQMKKHDSLEVAPDKPFWRNKKKGISSSTGAVVSPSKQISLCGQCVEQLQKWHVLLESGGIDKVQYNEFKATIMSDIKVLMT